MWLSLRICLSKARAGTMRRRVLTRPAIGPGGVAQSRFRVGRCRDDRLGHDRGIVAVVDCGCDRLVEGVPLLRIGRQRGVAPHAGRAGVEQFVRAYLSVQHRDHPDDGCPSAALLDEIGRSSDAIKRAYTDGALMFIDDLAARLAPDDPQSARATILSVFAMMLGTLQLSRALADRRLADEILEQGKQNALALLNAKRPA